MKETEDIIRSFKQAQLAEKKCALATVVHVEGSSYRRPGARMLVTEDGQLTGAISGGCLEGDALRKALLAISQQQNKLVTYDTTDEEDNSLGIQLGCNGIVYILFEPIDPSQQDHPVALLEKASEQLVPSVLITFFSIDNPSGEQAGTCALVAGEKKYGSIRNTVAAPLIEKDIEQVLKNKASVIKKYPVDKNKMVTGFIELVTPAAELVIAGAGNDAFPLVEMSRILGWHTIIVDGRKTHANTQRFPTAKKIVVSKPAEAVPQLNINEQSIIILMSHNYNYDLGMLRQLIKSSCRYIGVLGPKKKLEKMLDELSAEGINITAKDKEKIYGPVGLDIGAETAEEIALSIIAEIKTVLSNKNGATLRNKNGFIHDHSTVINALHPASSSHNQLSPADQYY
jgi:xanthine/CO dehydrogenase XdhC/CoxF family maturation factor